MRNLSRRTRRRKPAESAEVFILRETLLSRVPNDEVSDTIGDEQRSRSWSKKYPE